MADTHLTEVIVGLVSGILSYFFGHREGRNSKR